MAVFSEPAFIAMVVAAYIFGQLKTRLSRTTFFGVLNSVALIVLFGWKAFGILAFICIIYWCALRAAQLVSPENVTARRALPFVLFGGIAAFFVLHKMVLEPGNDFAILFPFHFFPTFLAYGLSFLACRFCNSSLCRMFAFDLSI